MTMDTPLPSVLYDVLEVISASSESSDCSLVREKVLDVLFRSITAEKAVLILSDPMTLSSHVMTKNCDDRFHNNYHTYYHRLDPLKLMDGMHRDVDLNLLPGVFTYSYDSLESTEYYTDFLKPQKVHHKLVGNLVSAKEIYGRIVWMRSQKLGRYAGQEICLAKTISPCLAHVLAYSKLRERFRLMGKIIDHIENQSSVATILLDEKLRVIHTNQRADELFDALESSETGGSGRERMLSQLVRNCREIKSSMGGSSRGCMSIPRRRVISDFKHTRFAVTFKALDQESGIENSLLFMICIEELPPPLNVDPQRLADSYHLSQREIDVTSHLFSGLKNAQIAEKLFVSEITVKKHLQSIYEKVGVNNRTSLINKILTRQYHPMISKIQHP
jgi:DNA-binding CsgD family transcriptional regulator